MSGIIGSKLNIRGSGLVGSLGTDGQHLLSAGAGKTNVFESTTAAESLVPLKQDIATLALHSAVADNKTAYNLPTAFIDQLEDDTGLLTQTDVDRVPDSEYVGTATAGSTDVLLLLHFEDTSPFLDSSMSARTVTTVGGSGVARHSTTNVGSYSAYFDGAANSYLTVPDHADFDLGGDFTIECWARHETAGHAEATLISKGYYNSGATTNFLFQRFNASTNDNVAYETNSTETVGLTYAGTGHYNDGDFHHYAWTRSGSTLYCYLDGVQKDTHSYSGTIGNNAFTLDIGRNLNGGTASFQGYISELLITKEAKYTSAFTPSTTQITDPAFNATGTLISNAQVAPAATTALSGVFLYKDNQGTASIGTDLKVYLSADNGSNFTEAASYGVVSPVFSTGIKMIRLGETTVTSGTQVKIKAVWANQSSGSKETQLHGWAVNY